MFAYKRKIALLMVVAVGTLVVFILFRPQPRIEVAPPIEAPLQDLTIRDGRLHRANESTPFTGIAIERYADQAVKSRSSISAGLLEGVSEGWHTNGQLQVREFFKSGISHGPRTKWYEDGKMMSETTIQDGKHHGIFRRWHENGQLAESMEMNGGEAHGVSSSYYPSGFIKAHAVLEKGKILQKTQWDDGEKRWREGEPTP